MSFYGKSFLYDHRASDEFGLFISEIDSAAINKSMGNFSVDIYEEKIFKRPTPFFYGTTSSNRLSFEISAHAEREIDAEEFQMVQKWLFGSKTYKQFQVVQEDMEHIYFQSIFNNPQITKVGNLIKGFTATLECDSPFAFAFPKTTTYSFTNPPSGVIKTFYNGSDDADDYLYPILELVVDNFGGGFQIENLDDNSRIFSFVTLSPSEELSVNCSLQTISSSTGLKRLSNFNKKFLRLVPGVNRLKITGNVESIAMTTQTIVKKI